MTTNQNTTTDPREAEIAQLREQVAVLQSQVDNADLNFDQIRMIERGKTRELQSTNSKLAAEVERLKTACEKEFQSVEQLSGENIKLAAEIAELKALLSSYHFDTSNPPAVVKAIIEGNIKDRAELETAKLTLFQAEKRLDEKLRTALAELDAVRKERDAYQEKAAKYHANLSTQLTSALADKDAAEKRADELRLLLVTSGIPIRNHSL